MSSAKKLQEAVFFIELLHALERRGTSLTRCDDPALEASFLFAAILNAFYSTIAMMEQEGVSAKAFRAAHPAIYAHGRGERAKTVHIAHVETAHSGYIPPRGDKVVLTFRRPPRLTPVKESSLGRADLYFREEHYMHIELTDRKVHALEFCEEHLADLTAFRASVTTK